MVTRTIFNRFTSPTEQNLYEDLVNEFTQINGMDLVFIPRTSLSPTGYDGLFGDDPTKAFTGQSYTIECYLSSADRFEGGEFFSKFGNIVKKESKFLMPNRAWKRETQGDILRPQEGDLLWIPLFKSLMEITFVDEEHWFYDLGKSAADPTAPETSFYGFMLTTRKFRYNNEVIDTDLPALENVVNSIIATYNFSMANTGTGTYNLGEMVYQTDDNTITGNVTTNATVSDWDLPESALYLNTITGLFLPNNNIFGANSGATWQLISYNFIDDVNNGLMDNQTIDTAANTILNWSEGNPFGQSD